MKIINATPHSIALIRRDGTTRIVERYGAPARIETESGAWVEDADGVPIHGSPRFVRITHLPDPAPETVIVVSQLVAVAVAALQPDRTDILYPGTAPDDEPVRMPRGVAAVRRLIRAV